jgi:E3 ubiquitin-protein ligase RHF
MIIFVLSANLTLNFQCQRSSQCPMCWQPISLKDPTRFNCFCCLCIFLFLFFSLANSLKIITYFSDFGSQELLEVVERERSFRFKLSRNATIFHHPNLGDFEL